MTMLVTVTINDDSSEYGTIMKQAEAQVIKSVLETKKWNQSAASRALGISRGCLRMKLDEYYPGVYTSKRGAL